MTLHGQQNECIGHGQVRQFLGHYPNLLRVDVVNAAASGCGQAYVIFAAPVDDPAEVMTAFERARTMWSTVLHSVEPVDTHLFCSWR